MFTTIYDKPGYDDYLELEPLGADTAGDQRLTSLDIHKSQRFCREQRYVPWFWSIPIVCNSCWTLPCGNFRIAMENWMLFGCFTYPKMSLCIVHFYIYNYLYTFIYIYIYYIVRLIFWATVYPFGSLKSPKRPRAHRPNHRLSAAAGDKHGINKNYLGLQFLGFNGSMGYILGKYGKMLWDKLGTTISSFISGITRISWDIDCLLVVPWFDIQWMEPHPCCGGNEAFVRFIASCGKWYGMLFPTVGFQEGMTLGCCIFGSKGWPKPEPFQ